MLVDLPDGKLMLIDGGGFATGPVDPGQQVVLPLLRARRRHRVDIAVLTHSHPDHLNGLATALREVEVGEFWVAALITPPPPHRQVQLVEMLRRRRVALRGPAELCQGARRIGGASVSVLGPCPGPRPEDGPNDNSIVLRLEFGQRSLLLVGDAGAKQEARLIHRHAERLQSDLLKVGHHGSATSSTAGFLDRVRPTAAVISCGPRNRFGHPHAATLKRLAERRALPVRTDQRGSVLWETNGHDTWLSARLP
jgi:competence protein ComEC